MEIDFTRLQRSMDELAKVFEQVFSNIFNNYKNLFKDIVEFLKTFKYKEKIKLKPVLKIRPNKLYYQDRTLKNYYCRNNCQ